MHREEQPYGGTRVRRPPPRQHVEIRSFDLRARPEWTRRLLTVPTTYLDTGNMRIIGAQAGTAWVVTKELHGVFVASGEVTAPPTRIEAENAELRGRLPQEAKYLEFDRGLIITTTDARRYRLDATTLRAEPYTPPPPPRSASFNDHQIAMREWFARIANPVGTGAFLTSGALFGDRWYGLLSDDEAKSVPESRTFPSLQGNELARRKLWTARMGSEPGS